MRVFDGRTGRYLGEAADNDPRVLRASAKCGGRRPKRAYARAYMGSTADNPDTPVGAESTFGAALWALLHPGQVQDEYAATGNLPPSVVDIMTGAASDVADTAGAALTEGAGNLQQMAQWLVVGVVALAAIELLSKLPKGK